MLVLHDPTTLLHSTVELLGARLIPALECPDRIISILKALEGTNHEVRLVGTGQGGEPLQDLSLLQKLLSATHGQGYLQHLRTAHAKWLDNGLLEKNGTVLPECFPNQRMFSTNSLGARLSVPPKDLFARSGYYAFDMSAGISEHTWTSAVASANLAVEGARIIMNTDTKSDHPTVLALCRPPGHHCTTSMAGGYCYINNAVIAVESIRHFNDLRKPRHETSVPKILILDIDFHHGNGTQDYFYEDPNVLFVSIHGQNEYPYYSGFEDETGQGRGKGFNVNLPLLAGSSFELYMEKVELAIQHIEHYEPHYLVVSLGFDTFHLDRLGSFKLYSESYEAIAYRFRSSKALKDIPTLILLEGGYVVESLGHNVASFLQGWERSSP
jgi:acetoin utilization deacetylase AcuC-like enzyme